MDHRQTVGFAPVRGNLCQELAVAHACRCRQSRCLKDALLDFPRNIHTQLNTFLIFRHIKKGFIEGYRLYQVSIVVEYLVQLCRHRLILLEMRLHDNQLRTQTLGHLYGLGRMYSEPPSLVAGSGYHTAFGIMTDCDGLAPQFWMIPLLHSSKELIHIHMNDLVHLSTQLIISLF